MNLPHPMVNCTGFARTRRLSSAHFHPEVATDSTLQRSCRYGYCIGQLRTCVMLVTFKHRIVYSTCNLYKITMFETNPRGSRQASATRLSPRDPAPGVTQTQNSRPPGPETGVPSRTQTTHKGGVAWQPAVLLNPRRAEMTPRARARVWPRPLEAAACHWAARSRRRASAAGRCLWGAGSRYLGAAPAGSRRRRPRAGRRARRALCRGVARVLGRGPGGWPRAGGRARSAGGDTWRASASFASGRPCGRGE